MAIVSRNAPTTQICSPTTQNTRKPTHTKESTKGGRAPKAPARLCGGGRRPPPFVRVGFRVFWVIGLHICVLGAFLETIALPAE